MQADTPHHPERADLQGLTYRLQRLAVLTDDATTKDELVPARHRRSRPAPSFP